MCIAAEGKCLRLTVVVSRQFSWQHFQHDPPTDKSTCRVGERGTCTERERTPLIFRIIWRISIRNGDSTIGGQHCCNADFGSPSIGRYISTCFVGLRWASLFSVSQHWQEKQNEQEPVQACVSEDEQQVLLSTCMYSCCSFCWALTAEWQLTAVLNIYTV